MNFFKGENLPSLLVPSRPDCTSAMLRELSFLPTEVSGFEERRRVVRGVVDLSMFFFLGGVTTSRLSLPMAEKIPDKDQKLTGVKSANASPASNV